MVTVSGYIIPVLRLIRWPNLLIIAATQVLIRQCIIIPLLSEARMEVQLSPMLFTLLVLATVFIAAGGYAINDYFDRKIDLVNKPDTIIVGTAISPRHAMAFHLFFSISGIVLGTFVAVRINEIYLSLVFFMVSGLLWFYSTSYKRELLLGNLIVALMTALVPFIVLLFELPLLASAYGASAKFISEYLLFWTGGFSLFAFLLNLVREVVKDAQDFEGDQAYGKSTIPVTWGINTARVLSVAFIFVVIALLAGAWFRFVRDAVTFAYFLALLAAPLLIAVYVLIRAKKVSDYRKANLILKIVMVSGLGYAIIANLVIKQMIP